MPAHTGIDAALMAHPAPVDAVAPVVLAWFDFHVFLDALDIRDHYIAGISMGGLVSVGYVALYPDGVRLLLIAAAPGVRSPAQSAFIRRLEAGQNPLLAGNEVDFDERLELVSFRPPSIPGPFKRAMLQDAIERQAT